MKLLDCPQLDEERYLDSIIEKKSGNHKKQLVDNKSWILDRYKLYLENKNYLENLKVVSPRNNELRKTLEYCYNADLDLKRNIRKHNSENLNLLCPFCMHDRISSVDHYLPKSLYPEFSIFSPNLLPSCKECNWLKSTDVPNDTRSYLHFYFDSFIEKEFLNCTIDLDEPSIRFSLIKDVISLSDFQIIENHFENLNLFNSYISICSPDLKFLLFKIQEGNLEKLKDFIIFEIEKLSFFGPNYFKLIFWKEALSKLLDKV